MNDFDHVRAMYGEPQTSSEPMSLSAEQLHTVLSMIEAEGTMRIVLQAQNFEETLIVQLLGRRYQVLVNGETMELS